MFQTNIVQSVLKGIDPIHAKSIQLKPGQIFQGAITKLYPGQLASLQLGGMMLTARLEAALTLGQRYWFQVQRNEGIPRLKVIDQNTVRYQAQANHNPLPMSTLLQQLGISDTKINEMLVRQFSNDALPFSKDDVAKGSEILTRTGMSSQEGISILKGMIERNLPLTVDTFQAVRQLSTGQPLSTQISELTSILQQTASQENSSQQLLERLSHFRHEATILPGQSSLIHLLNLMTNNESTELNRQGAEVLLRRFGLIPEGVGKEQFFQQFKEAVLNESNRSTVQQLWPFLFQGRENGVSIAQMDSKALFQFLMSRLQMPSGEQGEQRLQQLVTLMNQSINSNHLQQQLSNVMSNAHIISKTEKAALEHAVRLYELDGNHAHRIRSILNGLGMHFENEVMRGLNERNLHQEKLLDQLKPILLQAQQMNMNKQTQERIESIIQRITGHQLLSAEHVGPLNQYSVQIPLYLGHFQTDLTIQWEGKKKDNGVLDPDHCRIMFYLKLEQLQDTIVDVQIQNKIISIQIFNERERPNFLIETLQPLLQKKLEDRNYQLTMLKWKQIKETSPSTSKTNQHVYKQPRYYQGVDVRI